ncbi:hypothetical protein EZJ43_08000 [Pedobacter changchengzhani]|uniref:Uncharacterized protein n=1 Tax=Pedobacter changchengzhani TaxID=2529274 RepID=A0A4R5ML96_9SPHI|nr:hypothetical protein [Pedobacter changchengzhani]TDG36451.1 hypothetical protein EZJ43_08000 [Pedobacter changchengzhani]
MKVKSKMWLMLLILPLVSCQKHDFDLAQLTLPMAKDAITKKFEFKERSDFAEVTSIRVKDENALYFGEEKLSGTMVDEGSFFGTNSVTFQLSKKTGKIESYELRLVTKDESLKLEKALIEKFGEADYHYDDKKDFSFRIWEANQNTYFLEINHTTEFNGKKTISADLNVVNNKNKVLYNYYIAGGFGYYSDYLFEKNKPEHQNKKYTYKDFVNQKQKEDGNDSYFLKNYVK